MTALLFVCAANVCRSPMAEVVFAHRALELGLGKVASAGIHASRKPQPLDARARATLMAAGYHPPKRFASRGVADEDYLRYDRLLAVDLSTLHRLRERCPLVLRHKLGLVMDLAPGRGGEEIADPYYGPAQGFQQALVQIEAAAEAMARARWLDPI